MLKKAAKLPDEPGIYKFTDTKGQIIYIGKAKSLKKRVSSYFRGKNLGAKTDLMVTKIKDIKYLKVFSEFEAILLEAELIRNQQPFFNVQAKDDKSPLYIKITKEDTPIVTTTRREQPSKTVYLKGPFQSAKTARDILKIIRRIFPYCHHRNPKKPCLFVHLGLCIHPKSEREKKSYRKNISQIKRILDGKSKKVVRDLTREMKIMSDQKKYEQAKVNKEKIEKLQVLTTTYHAPKEFLEKPTLVDDLTLNKLKDLQKTLNLKKIPKRVECYDISNIQGKFATGSMVVFENGKKAGDKYRRFKIKFSEKPNDYEMLKEVLFRRFKNNWPHPDLIIIDGGRGQLNTALNVLSNFKFNIPVTSLAKRLEEIYTPQKSLPISLGQESPTRQLFEEIRNEAHRFANVYHKLLRSKEFLK